MERIDLNQNGFIKSVKKCIELLEAFGNKVSPELLRQYISEESNKHISTKEYLQKVITAITNGGSDFVEKIEELYRVKDEIIRDLSPEKIKPLLEKYAREETRSIVSTDTYLEQLARLCLEQDAFRLYLKGYVEDNIKKLIFEADLNKLVNEVVEKNAAEIAQCLSKETRDIATKALASLFVTKNVEELALLNLSRKPIQWDMDHPQNFPLRGGKK